MKPIAHFYHVYADGPWQDIALAHVEELHASGLMREMDEMYLGIVGRPACRREVKHKLPGVVIAEADTGWEQVTLQPLHGYAKTSQANIFYAHTKGAWSDSALATEWRVSMTHDTVTRWRECVQALESHDAAGPHWWLSDHPAHADHKYFFAGNFWWARSGYLATLPTVKNDQRFQAEGWIGLGEPSIVNMRHGMAFHGNFWRPS
jgi:hypothetical protein